MTMLPHVRPALLALVMPLVALSPSLAQTYSLDLSDQLPDSTQDQPQVTAPQQAPAVEQPVQVQRAPVSWDTYANPRFGYAMEIPLGAFVPSEESDNGDGITLLEVDGRGQIDIYGSYNAEGLSPDQYADFIAGTDRIREVTYSTGGNSWFVLSGYYNRQGDESSDLIFYTKYMFNADRSALAAFEVSFPEADKPFFAPLIERMEDSLRPPQ